MTARTICGRDPATGKALRVTTGGGRILAIEPGDPDETAFLSPGLVDLQVNGFAGHDLNAPDLTPETVLALSEVLRGRGVTTYVPTVITAPENIITRLLATIAAARRIDGRVAHAIPFVHVEGPSISPEDGPRGAHPLHAVRGPDIAEFDRWQAASGGLVGMVTLSPHYATATAYIGALAARGVLVAIGHTQASPAQIAAAADAGARLSTHLGNGIAACLPRHPNALWAQLADDRLSATFIHDGHHLPPDTFKAMVRAKGPGRCILVSDSVALGGLPPGRYQQPVGGAVELTADGRLALAGTPYLAGAARCLSECVALASAAPWLGLGGALAMATSNPGRFVRGRSELRRGAASDLIRFRLRAESPTWDIEDVVLGN